MKGPRPLQKITVREAFRQGTALLHGAANPFVEAKILLMAATGLDEVGLLASPDRPLARAEAGRFLRGIDRRLSGCPLAYIVGQKEFWSLPFRVGPGVLIPRPESEILVEVVLELPRRPDETIVDIGTGSGILAVALAGELPRARIVATDVSAAALKIAASNARRNGVERIAFRRGSLYAPLSAMGLAGACDVIVSNPPYVSAEDWRALPAEVREHEPKHALLGGPSGLEFIARLVRGAPRYLKRGGSLVFEIGAGQADGALALFDGSWTGARSVPDLRGIPRVIQAIMV